MGSDNGIQFLRGMVILWAGDPYSIPDGWAVCDGTKGTPDLRDKFFIGSGNGAIHAHGSSGGHASVKPEITVDQHVLTVSEMPSHNHGGATDIEDSVSIYYDLLGTRKDTRALTSGGRYFSTKIFNGGDHLKHTHKISNEGGNQGHKHAATSSKIDLHPPFYALYYIMKL